MKSANPTRLQLGMTGTFRGIRYRIAGRVVMTMEEAGVAYYWNEFHLVAPEGNEATLVFEQTEHGPQWRLFALFEPQYPITAEDAATKRVDDALNLEGTDVRVTRVDESRVHYVEAEAPEGVELGDVARYFNAEAPGFMVVVSWTGEEVECYEGWDLSADDVKRAFGLTGDPAAGFALFRSPTDSTQRSGALRAAAILLFLLAIGVVTVKLFSTRSASGSVTLLKAPALRPAISSGMSLTFEGKAYRVAEHVVLEVATVGRRYEQHEFRLDGGDAQARLILGFNPKKSDWFLLTPIEPQVHLTPERAAAVQSGQAISLGGHACTVTELFQKTVRKAESAEAADSLKSTRVFGFRAKSGSAEFLVEWNEAGVDYYSARPLSSNEITALP